MAGISMKFPILRKISLAILVLKTILVGILLFRFGLEIYSVDWTIDSTLIQTVIVGFIASFIDGALGMAYGVTCSTFLLAIGMHPQLTTSAIHTAKVFTSGVAGLSHLKFKNIDHVLFFRIVITGSIGAILGVFIVSKLITGEVLKPFISLYLLILGLVIIGKNYKKNNIEFKEIKGAEIFGFLGGVLDTIGGGGWGPIVTSNIISQGNCPRKTIGTVNIAEFFISFFSTTMFLFIVAGQNWKVIFGLIFGGIIAAPIAAKAAGKLESKKFMVLIGVLIVISSLYIFISSVGLFMEKVGLNIF